jgi:hypothetical protein
MKMENLEEEYILWILEKQIRNLEDRSMLMDPTSMDEITRQRWEIVDLR